MTPAPGNSRSEPLRLLQFTDLHLAPAPDGTVRGVATHRSFRGMAERYIRLLCTGYGVSAEYPA